MKIETGVFLSRLSPLYKGHQIIIDKMISDFGPNNSIIIMGSSNVVNDRTPFTFEQRKQMVETIYPQIKIIPIPDVNPELITFEKDTLDLWLESIKDLEKKMKAEFIFYGGSKKDIDYLNKDFKTSIVIDRNKGSKISASKVRKALILNDHKILDEMLDSRITPLAKEGFKNYILNEVMIGFKNLS